MQQMELQAGDAEARGCVVAAEEDQDIASIDTEALQFVIKVTRAAIRAVLYLGLAARPPPSQMPPQHPRYILVTTL
jgi:hypothetical protein